MKKTSLLIIICICLSIQLSTTSAYAKMPHKPILTRLPFSFSDVGRTPMENTPVLFQSRLLLVSNYRPGGAAEAKGKDACLYIDDLQTGMEVDRFGQGHSFVSAYVNGIELNVFALEFSDFGRVMNSTGIDRLTSIDLESWKTEKVIMPEGNEHLFNSSVCCGEKGFLMAYESDKPVQFCFKFARSSGLAKWEKVPGLAFTGVNHEYSASPLINN